MESGNGDAIQERSAKMCGMVNPIKSNSNTFKSNTFIQHLTQNQK